MSAPGRPAREGARGSRSRMGHSRSSSRRLDRVAAVAVRCSNRDRHRAVHRRHSVPVLVSRDADIIDDVLQDADEVASSFSIFAARRCPGGGIAPGRLRSPPWRSVASTGDQRARRRDRLVPEPVSPGTSRTARPSRHSQTWAPSSSLMVAAGIGIWRMVSRYVCPQPDHRAVQALIKENFCVRRRHQIQRLASSPACTGNRRCRNRRCHGRDFRIVSRAGSPGMFDQHPAFEQGRIVTAGAISASWGGGCAHLLAQPA